jgi:hypothetical protein
MGGVTGGTKVRPNDDNSMTTKFNNDRGNLVENRRGEPRFFTGNFTVVVRN